MSKPWIDIIGIGEDGWDGLSTDAQQQLREAEIIIGGDRHHKLASGVDGERVRWPSPFDAMIDVIRSYRGKRLVILVTGDPLWYSVGARIIRAISAEEIRFHPQLSAFQWAACRMGWSLADCDTLTIHGRPVSQIVPHLAPRARLLILTKDETSPQAVAELLNARGFGDSTMTVLAALGGPQEQRFSKPASEWDIEVPAFHVLAVECVAASDAIWHSRAGGWPDEAFCHDGQITKQDIRAATISKLAPFNDGVLWDIGAGCGSVAIEWMFAARGAMAVAIEPRDDRLDLIRKNSVALGAEKISIIKGRAPDALAGLPSPDAVFIGGGISEAGVFEAAFDALPVGGRLVANVVTLEGEARLGELHQAWGGELVRLSIQKAQSIGGFRGWRAAMPVTQWLFVKQAGTT